MFECGDWERDDRDPNRRHPLVVVAVVVDASALRRGQSIEAHTRGGEGSKEENAARLIVIAHGGGWARGDRSDEEGAQGVAKLEKKRRATMDKELGKGEGRGQGQGQGRGGDTNRRDSSKPTRGAMVMAEAERVQCKRTGIHTYYTNTAHGVRRGATTMGKHTHTHS